MLRILILNFCVLFIFNLANPMIPLMLEAKNSPDYLNGFLFASMNLSQLIFSPIVVKLYAFFKPKTLVMIAPFLYGVTQIGFAFFESPILMITFRLMSGCAVALFSVSILIFVHSIKMNEDKYNKYSLLFASNSLGGIFGLFTASILGRYGLYLSFYLQPILGAIFIVLSGYMFVKIKDPEVNKKVTKVVDNLTVVFTTKRVFILFLLMTLFISGYVVFNSNINYFATDRFDINSSQSSYISMAIAFLVLITNLFIVNVITKYKLYTILATICVVMLTLFVFSFTTNYIFVILLTFILFVLSFNVVRPMITNELVRDIDTSSAAKYLSATNSINSFASIIGGAVTGIVYSFNPYNMFYLIFVLLIIIGVVLIFGRKYVKI